MKSEAVIFHEALCVSLCFDVLRRDVEHTLEDASCALRFDVRLQVTLPLKPFRSQLLTGTTAASLEIEGIFKFCLNLRGNCALPSCNMQ